MFKVLVPESLSRIGMDYLRAEDRCLVIDSGHLAGERFLEELPTADALLVRSKTKVTRDLLSHAPRLRVVGRAGSGVDNIDVEACTDRGILVMNTPGGNSVSVAEHALALMLALARNIPRADSSMKCGQWLRAELEGMELKGKTLAVAVVNVDSPTLGNEVFGRLKSIPAIRFAVLVQL